MGMLHLRVEPSGSQQAKVAGMLRPATKALGLSFGDPACFAVARINTATALATIGSGLNCPKLWASQCSCCAEKREPQRGTARGTDAGGGADTFVRSFLRLAAQRSRPAPSLHRPRASRYRRDRHGHLQSNDRLRARCQDQNVAECDVHRRHVRRRSRNAGSRGYLPVPRRMGGALRARPLPHYGSLDPGATLRNYLRGTKRSGRICKRDEAPISKVDERRADITI